MQIMETKIYHIVEEINFLICIKIVKKSQDN